MGNSWRYKVPGPVVGVFLYGTKFGAAAPMTAIAQVGAGVHAGSSHASAQETAQRAGGMPEIALRSSDSLSDTKIFVLLAAIVFVFLLALGVAMTRVSRGRRRHHAAHMEHQMANTAVPTTLNKTILDLLPVFEVTAKRQLRQLQAGTPRVLNECFSDSISAQSVVMGCEGSNSHKLAAPTAGYGLDSGKASLCSDSGAGHSYVSDTSVLTGNCGAVELPTWRRLKRTPSPCRMVRAIETPPPAILRYYGDSATPPLARMPSDRWEATPESADVNIGAVVYRARSTRSLDVTPGRETPGAWAAHSQPDIGRRASADGEGLGSCPICLEEFDCGDHLRELPCLHRYHLMCIDTWLVSRSTCCPYCKMDIRRWYYGPDFDDSIPHVRPDTHPDLTPHAAPRTLHRIEGYHSGHSSLSRAWRALRSALN